MKNSGTPPRGVPSYCTGESNKMPHDLIWKPIPTIFFANVTAGVQHFHILLFIGKQILQTALFLSLEFGSATRQVCSICNILNLLTRKLLF